MKAVRDLLIIVVFGGVVVIGAIYAFTSVHQYSLAVDPVIGQAEAACQEDGMICHVGFDTFSSVESAQSYLDSPTHLARVKARKLQLDLKAEEEALAKAGPEAVRKACLKLHTISCRGIDKSSVGLYANLVTQEKNRLREEAEASGQHP